MYLFTQPQGKPNCLVYSAAMVFDVQPKEIFDFINHDGQEVWWPDQVGNGKLRGVHIQEIIEYGLNINRMLTPIEAHPKSAPAGTFGMARSYYPTIVEGYVSLGRYLSDYDAILITQNHAVAWNHKELLCYDPNGPICGISEYQVHEAWLVNEIKSS